MLFFCSVQFCVVEIVMNQSVNRRTFFQCRVKVPKEPMLILEDMFMKLLPCIGSKIWHWLEYLLLNTVGSLGKCYCLFKKFKIIIYQGPALEQPPLVPGTCRLFRMILFYSKYLKSMGIWLCIWRDFCRLAPAYFKPLRYPWYYLYTY